MVRRTTLFNYSQLQEGSFRGVPFFMENDGTTTGGRKNITHEYPNTDKRFVEDLGLLRKTFAIVVMVDTTTTFANRDELIEALEKEGAGELIHPFYGSRRVFNKGYSVVNRYGIAVFNITFETVNNNVLPSPERSNTSLVENQKNSTRSIVSGVLGDVFDVTVGGFKVFEKGVGKVNSSTEVMLDAANSVLNTTNELGNFQNLIFDTQDNLITLAKTPSLLASRYEILFENFELVPQRGKDLFDMVRNLFDFGDDDTDTKTDTQIQRQIKTNNEVVNNLIKANALAIGYNTAINLNYRNEEELLDVQNILETQYESIIDELDFSTANSIQALRSNALVIFNRLEKSVPKIFTIDVNTYKNIHQIVYNYYGNFANSDEYERRVDDIIDLNGITNPSKIRGTIKLLTV